MITTITPYTDSRNIAAPGTGWDGVVRVVSGGYYGTGVLLYDGHTILTSAHLFTHGTTESETLFETAQNGTTISSTAVTIHPDYDPAGGNNDLALIHLPRAAPAEAERYELYRHTDEIGQDFTAVGYGRPGNGLTGALEPYSGTPLRLKAGNTFDTDGETLKESLGSGLGWQPDPGVQLIADFDDGTTTHDALGLLTGHHDTGVGQSEGMIGPGDSGGPAFIEGLLAGVATYTAALSQGSINPDVDDEANSSFGEIGSWQRISHHQEWLDRTVRDHLPGAPTRPEEVRKFVQETDSETVQAYFLLQFTGTRTDPSQVLHVDYATRDGSATAGKDYLAASGTLNLYPGEDRAVIPVEVLGDTVAESDETFFLDVFNPEGGSFGDGVVKLTAVRTIVDWDTGQ